MNFNGRLVLVTGSGRGIGMATAMLFAKMGATVGCNDLTDSCEVTCEQIKSLGGKALALQFDITNSSQVDVGIRRLIDKFGRIDILVNNAGGSTGRALVHEMDEAMWDQTVAVNLKGCFLCSKAVLPSMIEARYGKIINIASIRAETGLERDSAYAAAKAGLYGFTRSLAKEVARHKINVNVISPGIIRTSDSAVLPWEEYGEIVPLGVGRPDDIAQGVLFLSSDASSYITGQVLHINGGWWPTIK
jgi:NAD(P)-dependent dehydrogenase (short-subunit alcohol dehydrogenase family)